MAMTPRVLVVRLLRPRIEIGIAMLIVGLLAQTFFGQPYGIVLVVVGIAEIVYSLIRDRGRGALKVTASALVLVALGSTWLMATRPDGPPSLELLAADADDYRAALAAGDLETYLNIAKPILGVTLEDAFTVERACLDWEAAGVAVAPSEVSLFGVVTFSTDDASLVRTFGYQSHPDRWIATVEPNC